MKSVSFSILVPVLFLLIIGGVPSFFYNKQSLQAPVSKTDIISCGFPANDISAAGDGKFIPILPGWGTHSYKISTDSDSAQIYFNQGLNFYYSYHFREALASFKESARFDKNCAMAYWGQALAMGPYYNNYYYKMGKDIPAVLRLMDSYAPAVSEKEKWLIKAMQQRYSNDFTNADRPALDSAYAAAMKKNTVKFAADDDMKALYIDAVMLEHKWDFWDNNGRPKKWTPELVKLCKQVLDKQPSHPAALHYYIHVTESSRHPEMALPAAEILKDAMPGVGHMVHMATHMYQRNGLFGKGVLVNEDANTVNNKVDDLAPNLGIGKDRVIHIYAVQSYCAMNAGMYTKALPVYQRVRTRMLAQTLGIESDAYSQYVFMMPVIAMVRTGKWAEILVAPSPDIQWKYATVLDNFAKGLAHVQNGNLVAARHCLISLESILKDSLLAIRLMPFNAPVQCGKIAAGILRGELYYAEGKIANAISAFKEAVAEEDRLIYREPQEWLIPARQYLGAYLLKAKHIAAAENVYREDLVANPGNGWSLLGLYNCSTAGRKKSEVTRYKRLYRAAFKDADIKPVASVF